MSNSSLVNITIPANTNNYKLGRSGRKIEKITIHHMAGVLSAEQCGRIFQDGTRRASSHYGIGKDGEIGLYVDEENTAYTDGDWDSNCRSVTIETSNSEASGSYPISNNVLSVLIKLVADVAKRNNLGVLVKAQNVTWHQMHTTTTCPGEYLLSKMDYIISEANKINNEEMPSPIVPDRKSNAQIANEVIAGRWGNGEDRKNRLTNAGYNFNDIQSIVNSKLKSRKSNEEVANEVIQGKWGNGEDRRNKLIAAGYDYNVVQRIVNEKLR